uniref:(northern house mosquito) hypothetical protein n=1 Tax=Culex pipiens TaxID=7175 RepID=A0A8D8BT07_CULPI
MTTNLRIRLAEVVEVTVSSNELVELEKMSFEHVLIIRNPMNSTNTRKNSRKSKKYYRTVNKNFKTKNHHFKHAIPRLFRQCRVRVTNGPCNAASPILIF